VADGFFSKLVGKVTDDAVTVIEVVQDEIFPFVEDSSHIYIILRNLHLPRLLPLTIHCRLELHHPETQTAKPMFP